VSSFIQPQDDEIFLVFKGDPGNKGIKGSVGETGDLVSWENGRMKGWKRRSEWKEWRIGG
jgi:hypothetical protein